MNFKNAFAMGSAIAVLGSLSVLHAADAVLVQKSGTVTVTLPNGTVKELSQGDTIPEGASITTSAGSIANVEPVAGAIATLQGGTTVKLTKIAVTQDSAGTVTKQEVLLDLSSGDLVATIDPSKRAVNDFKVQTPKGVAAARGTDFSVSVSDNGFSVAATADSVSFTATDGTSYTIVAGQISVTPPGSSTPGAPIPLSQAASNPAIAAEIQTAVATVSNVVANNLAGLSAEAALNLMTQVVGVASNATPAQASAFAATAAAAVTSPTSATASIGTQAAAQIAGAAAAGAPGQASAIAISVTNTVTTASGATAGSDAAASIAGAVTASVATATNTSISTLAISVAAGTGNSTSSVVAAANSPSPTTGNTAGPTGQPSTSTPTVTTPINPSVVSPSS